MKFLRVAEIYHHSEAYNIGFVSTFLVWMKLETYYDDGVREILWNFDKWTLSTQNKCLSVKN
jgi:hypothetical protein